MKKKKKSVQKIRLAVQMAFFALVFYITAGKWLAEKGIVLPFAPGASLHSICPFGGVVTIYEFVTTGEFIQKIHSSSFILMLIVLVTAILFGPVFCGYICPFGSFQEWLGKLGKKLFPMRYNRIVPIGIDRVLKFLRYLVLILVLYKTAAAAKLLFQSLDPYYALFNFFTDEVALSAYLILGLITVLSLITERPWCKYLCPYGALLGLFNFVRIFSIRRRKETCISCMKCDKVCPMNIKVSEKEDIRDPLCISCHKCTSESACPVNDTVVISAGKLRKKEEARDEN